MGGGSIGNVRRARSLKCVFNFFVVSPFILKVLLFLLLLLRFNLSSF